MELLLKEHELLNLGERLNGVKLVCGDGYCWITQAGDSRDHFIKPGESYTVTAKGHVIVVALQPSRLMLCRTQSEKAHLFYRIIDSVLKRSAVAGA